MKYVTNTLCRVCGTACAIALAVPNTVAQTLWEPTPLSAKSLTLESLPIPQGWRSGVLRVALTPVAGPWRLELDYGKAGRLVLDETTASARIVRRESNRLIVDLPLVTEATIKARTEPATMQVLPLQAITPRAVHGEQMIPKSDVVSLTKEAANALPAIGPAFARAELMTQSGAILGVCTAFRIAKGFWLTAAHCAYRQREQEGTPPIAYLRLQTDAYAGPVEALPMLKARVVASGLQDTQLGLESIMQPGDLDYALLETADDPGGAEIRLGKGAPAPPGTKLVLYHYWIGEFEPAAGKVYSTGESCAVYESLAFPDPAKPALCRLQHGCSSETGASGSPVIRRDSNELVGLHYGAGLTRKFNCALTAETVRSDLCQRAPTVAGGANLCQ